MYPLVSFHVHPFCMELVDSCLPLPPKEHRERSDISRFGDLRLHSRINKQKKKGKIYDARHTTGDMRHDDEVGNPRRAGWVATHVSSFLNNAQKRKRPLHATNFLLQQKQERYSKRIIAPPWTLEPHRLSHKRTKTQNNPSRRRSINDNDDASSANSPRADVQHSHLLHRQRIVIPLGV